MTALPGERGGHCRKRGYRRGAWRFWVLRLGQELPRTRQLLATRQQARGVGQRDKRRPCNSQSPLILSSSVLSWASRRLVEEAARSALAATKSMAAAASVILAVGRQCNGHVKRAREGGREWTKRRQWLASSMLHGSRLVASGTVFHLARPVRPLVRSAGCACADCRRFRCGVAPASFERLQAR